MSRLYAWRRRLPPRVSTYDALFAGMATVISGVSYLVPFLYYPDEQSSPWPYAYNVIQSQIIASGHFLNRIPQLGSLVPFDYGWFAVHHLTIVMFKLTTGLSFESQERILTFLLAPIFFCGFYIFVKHTLGNPLGFLSSLFFVAIPRTYNYLVNVNGEYIGWLILLPALIAFFAYARSQRTRLLILSALLASALVISNLIVFAEYVLIVGSYLLARTVLLRDTRHMILHTALILGLFLLVIPVPVLVTSGNLVPGSSSTIGSLYSPRSTIEAQYEGIYYQQYDWYWQLFVHRLPLQVQLYYISNDGNFLSILLVLLAPLSALGVLSCLLERKKLVSLFVLIWFGASTFASSLLLSPLFNPTVNAGSIRLLLYFAWPMSVTAGMGFLFLWRRIRHRWKPLVAGVFLIVLVIEGVQLGALSANQANEYPQLYAREYLNALKWLGTNTPPNAVVVVNDWTIGEVWINSHRLSLTESGRGSAAYSSYQDVVTTLGDAVTILATTSLTETVQLMNKYNASWVMVWNRPSASYVVDPNEVYFQKFQSSPFIEVFDEIGDYLPSPNTPYTGDYRAWAIIYQLTNNTTPIQLPMNQSPETDSARLLGEQYVPASSTIDAQDAGLRLHSDQSILARQFGPLGSDFSASQDWHCYKCAVHEADYRPGSDSASISIAL